MGDKSRKKHKTNVDDKVNVDTNVDTNVDKTNVDTNVDKTNVVTNVDDKVKVDVKTDEYKINVPLIPQDDIKAGRGGGRGGDGIRYVKYTEACNERNLAAWIKQEIKKCGLHNIKVRTIDMGKELGMDIRPTQDADGLSETAFQWGIKYALFFQGIDVTSGRTKKDEHVLVFSLLRPNKKLPSSLRPKLKTTVAGKEADKTASDKAPVSESEQEVDLTAAEKSVEEGNVSEEQKSEDEVVDQLVKDMDNAPSDLENKADEDEQPKDE